ncbi:carbonyl reductase (NADPH-dependent) ari1 [Aspergillus thermomutatus]|uniref:Terpene synthase n=1 Tax=Aspergillus thermomutatus TaxID=41047 RepID=A0A397GIV5_ASPTH|nr:carbonyl reductase (NADPH-dependent) ari1 [Aspergillus thermomutatus]RHZ50905.1 carbonyl reductase (NADPH-dependent) ari1 [Aspergillus thermomutatus]
MTTLSVTKGTTGSLQPPPTLLQPLCHPRVDEVTKEVDGYFLEHWKFPNEKARKKFVAAGFSRVTCLYFPKALDDRIHFACRLLTVLFLIDDLLESMSFQEGFAYNEKLIPISRGDVLPDRSVPVEYIIYDLWESMRAHDREMADDILEPVFLFMRAQTEQTRSRPMGLGEYLAYRERDVGKELLAALMRFAMALELPASELKRVREIDANCSKHISVINDIYSYEKELHASQTAHSEGGVLCTSVHILAQEADFPAEAAKRVLFFMCREWERRHRLLVKRLRAEGLETPGLRAYVEGLEYQMSGNELWSRTTERYSFVAG